MFPSAAIARIGWYFASTIYHPNGTEGSEAVAGTYIKFSDGVIARTEPESVGFFVVSIIWLLDGIVKNWV